MLINAGLGNSGLCIIASSITGMCERALDRGALDSQEPAPPDPAQTGYRRISGVPENSFFSPHRLSKLGPGLRSLPYVLRVKGFPGIKAVNSGCPSWRGQPSDTSVPAPVSHRLWIRDPWVRGQRPMSQSCLLQPGFFTLCCLCPLELLCSFMRKATVA